MTGLNETERAVMIEFLDQLEQDMGNNGCNDYQVPDTEEGRALVAESYSEIDEADRPTNPGNVGYDWMILGVLRKKLNLTNP